MCAKIDFHKALVCEILILIHTLLVAEKLISIGGTNKAYS